jgi:GR25 family glycosyltransferase involved in LPS biosynthesis
MKSFVINLQRRPDRLAFFNEKNADKLSDLSRLDAIDGKSLDIQMLNEMGYDTNKDWIDPIRKTKLSHGEVGCFLSHWKAWEKCVELNEPILIFEDDAILTDEFDEKEIEKYIQEHELFYLAWLEMRGDRMQPIDEMVFKPFYPYWLCAYAITPSAARTLLDGQGCKSIIPADEYVPFMLDRLKSYAAYYVNVAETRSKEEGRTDIDPLSEDDYFIDFPVHVVTVGTDPEKCHRLKASAEHFGIEITNLGHNVEWEGTDMTGPGGGHKINLLRRYIANLPNHHVVLFVDGYDVFFAGDLDTITRRYFGFGKKILFAAESTLWPDKTVIHPLSDTKYRYLNSGVFMGEVGALRSLLAYSIGNEEDDQLFYQKQYLSGRHSIALDHECYVFQCHEPEIGRKNDLLHNPYTSTCPRIYHGNGGREAKENLDRIYKTFNFSPTAYLKVTDVQMLDRDMLLVDFMTPSMCEDMIRRADEHGEWGSLSYDKFPAMEIRLKKLGMWEQLEEHWQKVLFPVIERHWYPMEMYALRDAFVMRYSLDTQTSLRLHTDASLVTGSVKLNDDYLGADLYFPRQKVSNRDIPIGKCILFPGQVTHGHTCTELTHGVKYSLTMWTSRYRGDLV